MAPRWLTPSLQSLPPILCMICLISILICSKAPWGLPVLSRVNSIFTVTSISPDALLRQCPNRYAFRAGQNLPDKEFRYLRTVIVTAAVYRGLSSQLRRWCHYLLRPWDSVPIPCELLKKFDQNFNLDIFFKYVLINNLMLKFFASFFQKRSRVWDEIPRF